MSWPRVLPVGDAAATVELGDTLDLATNERVRALDRQLQREPFDGLLETVPALRSLGLNRTEARREAPNNKLSIGSFGYHPLAEA